MSSTRASEIESKLRQLKAEMRRLEEELSSLKVEESLDLLDAPMPPFLGSPRLTSSPTSLADRVALFLELFRCRKSVFPKRWENAGGRSGYSPFCDNEWVRGICGKPPHGRVKCSECPNQAFRELDDESVKGHLQGLMAIGTYAIREDDSTVFIACDFDGLGWKDEAFLYQSVARTMGVEVIVERSRSGDGAHTWIFFSEPVPARLARALGTMILAKCFDVDHRMGFESFDRFFPNQDFLPKGGFGNLIALPFQGVSKRAGNSVFISGDLEPVAEQWGPVGWSQQTLLARSEVRARGALTDPEHRGTACR